MIANEELGFTDSALYVEMLRAVPVSKILSRLGDEHMAKEVMQHYAETTDIAWGTNAHTLMHWEHFMDDLMDCIIELGYPHPDINHVFPAEIFNPGGSTYKSKIFIDLEN